MCYNIVSYFKGRGFIMKNKIIVINGGKALRKYIRDYKKMLGAHGLHTKLSKKKNDEGEVIWQKEYWYRKYKRSEEEKAKMVEVGYDKDSAYANWGEKYLGAEPPKGFETSGIMDMYNSGRLEIDKNDNTTLITDIEAFQYIKQTEPEYFRKLNYFEV